MHGQIALRFLSLASHGRGPTHDRGDSCRFTRTTRGAATLPLLCRFRGCEGGEPRVHLGTAVLGQKANQVRGFPPVHGIIDETPRSLCAEQTRARERVQVVGERGARHLEPSLDVVDALALRSSADEEAEDLQAVFLTQRAELLDYALFHHDLSSIIETSIQSNLIFSGGQHPFLAVAGDAAKRRNDK